LDWLEKREPEGKNLLHKSATKDSYTVPCSSQFRDSILALARSKACNVADLARSVVLLAPAYEIEMFPDPGGPARDDRETVVLKSGRSKGRPWRRKPRLQVRISAGFAIETIRKALGLALAVERGDMSVGVESQSNKSADMKRRDAQEVLLRETLDETERLRNVIKVLHFEPLPAGVITRVQALYVLGFAPGSIPDQAALRIRFRRLATVYHPDGKDGCHDRMSQLNAAMEVVRRGGF